MKKSYLWSGLVMTGAGVLCLLAALFWDTPLDSLLCGFFGAFTASGVVQIYRYCRYTSPRHGAEYREKLEQEQIDLRDERKEMLRNKAGRCAYALGLVLTAALIVVFSVLGKLGVVEEGESRLLVIVLAVCLLAEYAAGILIYRLLARKY